jgi:2-polyprenyl-6-methoxyphenol hydroxylase-like FAD-dependent oxidoreductase
MTLAFLPLRAGLSVTVMEKHADFLRDFRGDTLHASTIALSKAFSRPFWPGSRFARADPGAAALRLIDRTPILQGLTARLVGIGLRPEHV